jgi:predicted protein tyrosine phosphatase
MWRKDTVIHTRSAGTSRNARRRLLVADLRWADLVLVMETKHFDRIRADFRAEVKYKDVQVLDIPDDYQFMDAELVGLLQDVAGAAINAKLADFCAATGIGAAASCSRKL